VEVDVDVEVVVEVRVTVAKVTSRAGVAAGTRVTVTRTWPPIR